MMPLQDMPQMFSSIQTWQMAKPHLHRQQKRTVSLQQWQSQDSLLERRLVL